MSSICLYCNGNGRIFKKNACYRCGGSGRHYSGSRCMACGGIGTGSELSHTCPACYGTGHSSSVKNKINQQQQRKQQSQQHQIQKKQNNSIGGFFYIITIFSLIFFSWWLLEKIENSEILEFPYNKIAEYYNIILRKPLLFIVNNLLSFFCKIILYKFTNNIYCNIIISLSMISVPLFAIYKYYTIYMECVFDFFNRKKFIFITLLIIYLLPALLIFIYFIVRLFI